jgi:hypothetical protein
MIPFLNRNSEKWPHTRQIKIAGRNHILPPLGIENTLIIQSYKSIQNGKSNASLLQAICFVKRFDYKCSLFSG